MPRNLDMTALRSFVAVADSGGVTRAAGALNLTQSAVSMQLKRLEENLGLSLLDRSARTIALTSAGEQLLSYGRRLLTLNDEVYGRMTDQAFEGEIVIGVPHDIVYPALPRVLKIFAAEYPRVRVQLVSSFTSSLKKKFADGEIDVILTTEETVDPGGAVIANRPMVWVGAQGGQIWRERPLRLAFEHRCIFRAGVQRSLDEAGIPWIMAVEADSFRAIGAMVMADLAVHTMLEGSDMGQYERISHNGALPDLKSMNINLYARQAGKSQFLDDLVGILRTAYSAS